MGVLEPENIVDEYSGDGDYDPHHYEGPKINIPTEINLENGVKVNVTFGVTKSDLKSANNPVKPELVEALKKALNEASNNVNITHLHISSTTNGSHHPESNHYKSKAMDISRINGNYIFDIQESNLVMELQKAFDNYQNIRENFGPALKHKLGEPYSVGGHHDHIHISVN